MLLQFMRGTGLAAAATTAASHPSAVLRRCLASQSLKSSNAIQAEATAMSQVSGSNDDRRDSSASGQDSSSHASSSSNQGSAKPELVARFLGLELAAQPERLRRNRLLVTKEFQRHTGDVGSPEVTVAIWTHRIRELCQYFKDNRKNVHQMRQLELMFNRRRRLLRYMRREDFQSYCYVIHKLGLKDVYIDIHGEDRYPEGSLHGQPVDDSVIRFRFAFHPEYLQKKTSLWKRLKPKLMAEDPQLGL